VVWRLVDCEQRKCILTGIDGAETKNAVLYRISAPNGAGDQLTTASHTMRGDLNHNMQFNDCVITNSLYIKER